VFCTKRHRFMYCYSKKEKKRQSSKQCHFGWHYTSSTSPRRAVGRGKGFFPLLCITFLFLSLSLSLSPICLKTLTQPTPPHSLPPWWKGQRGQALQATLGWLRSGHPSYTIPSPWLDRSRVAPLYKYHPYQEVGGQKKERKKTKRKMKKERNKKRKGKKEKQGKRKERKGRKRKTKKKE